MTTTAVKLATSCELILTEYSTGAKDLALDYTEHATNHWGSDTETSIALDKHKAQEIIALLQKFLYTV